MGKSVTRRIAKKQPDLLLFDGRNCVSVLKALGEDNRVRIVGLLMDAPLGVCEIARRLGSTYYNVSKHLRILRVSGLLEVEKHGGGNACMSYRKESGEAAHTRSCWILAVAASSSSDDRHSP